MKKFKLVIILFFSLFIKQLQAEPNSLESNFSEQKIVTDELRFETNGDYKYLMGILPSAQVFFNIVPEVSVALSFEAKTKNSDSNLFSSKTKIVFNLSFHQISSFSRHCSTFIQIYLRTACFRL